MAMHYIYAWQFTAPQNGIITKVSVFNSGDLYGSNFVVGIYSDTGSNYPGSKIGQATEVAVSGSGSWFDSNALSVEITAGSKYWIVSNQNANINNNYDSSGVTKYASLSYNSTLPATFPAISNEYARTYSLYATYTLTGSIGSKTLQARENY